MRLVKLILPVLIMALSMMSMAQAPKPPAETAVPDDIEKRAGAEGETDVLEEGLEEGSATEELSRQFHLGEPGLTGIIVDRTITMVGREFYRQFTRRSQDSAVMSDTNLSIHERPDARWGSQVWITENNTIMFEARLPPRLSDIEAYAEAAIEQVQTRIIQESITRALGNDPDLADDEI